MTVPEKVEERRARVARSNRAFGRGCSVVGGILLAAAAVIVYGVGVVATVGIGGQSVRSAEHGLARAVDGCGLRDRVESARAGRAGIRNGVVGIAVEEGGDRCPCRSGATPTRSRCLAVLALSLASGGLVDRGRRVPRTAVAAFGVGVGIGVVLAVAGIRLGRQYWRTDEPLGSAESFA